MSQALIERMEKTQEYIRYDINAMKAEVKRIQEARQIMRSFETDLKWLIKTIERNKEHLFDKGYQKKLIEVWKAFPELATIRQVEVILRALKHKKNSEIAKELFITEKCVKFHKTKAFKKCGVKSTSEMIKKIQERESGS